MTVKHFELYRWYKEDEHFINHERDLSILRIGGYWLFNFNKYDAQVLRSVGVTINLGLSWPGSDLFTLNLYLYKKNYSFSFLQRDYGFWDEEIEIDLEEKPKNEGT